MSTGNNSIDFPECWSDDLRMRVLFNPLRPRNVNPVNYDAQVKFWKTLISNYARSQMNPRISLTGLASAFERKGERPHCLAEILTMMESCGDIKVTEKFLEETNVGWASWSVQVLKRPLQLGSKLIRDKLFNTSADPEISYIVLEIVNAQAESMLKSLKNQIISRSEIKKRLSEWNISPEALDYVLHELQCRQKLVVQHLREPGESSHDHDQMIIYKFGTESHKAFPFSEIELAIHKLEFTEKDLMQIIANIEDQISGHENSAKEYLKAKKRVLAKNALRKRDLAMKRLKKREKCLENIQGLVQRIHDVTDDAAVLDAYRTGTKSLQTALSKSGITLDTVEEAIAEMQDVIELHEELQKAVTGGTDNKTEAEAEEADLERELEELVASEGNATTKDTKALKESADDDDDLLDQLNKLEIADDPIGEKESQKSQKEAECL